MSKQSRSIAQAIEDGDLATARTLCRLHGPQLKTSGDLQYLLKYAVGANCPDVLSVLIDAGAEVNAPLDQYTNQGVLYTAAACGAKDSVRWLVRHGAIINRPEDGTSLCLPLFVAIRCGHLEIVELLVEAGADLEATWKAETAVECASRHGFVDIENYLRAKS